MAAQRMNRLWKSHSRKDRQEGETDDPGERSDDLSRELRFRVRAMNERLAFQLNSHDGAEVQRFQKAADLARRRSLSRRVDKEVLTLWFNPRSHTSAVD